MTSAHLIARLVAEGLGVAVLPSADASRLTGVTTIEVADAPTRVEHVAWSRDSHPPAAAAFLAVLGITG